MFNWIKTFFKKEEEQPEVAPLVVSETPKSTVPYSRETHRAYFEIMLYNDNQGRRAIVRFYPYDNKQKPEEVVIGETNADTLKKKVDRLVEQKMSKYKR